MTKMLLTLIMVTLSARVNAQDRATEVLHQMRAAIGADKLAAAKALTVEGPFVRDAGDRQMKGTAAVTIQVPDRMYRSEEMELPGGMSAERIWALTGDKAWDDVRSRGGVGGNVGMMITRQGGPGQELNPEAVEQARLRRARLELTRYLLAFLGAGHLQPTFVAVADSPDGKADVLEVKDDLGQTVRAFIDQKTHLPLMLQFQGTLPRVVIRDGGRIAGPAPGRAAGGAEHDPATHGEALTSANREEARRRMEALGVPQPTLVSLFLSDFRNVDGMSLPHRLVQSADGKTFEEWTIEKVKVNPSIKADLFDKE